MTLLIRGAPGTGKTTLALGLLDSFPGRRVYVTGRVTRDHLGRSFPWLAYQERWEVIDLAEHPSSMGEARRMLDAATSLVAEPRSEELLQGLWLPGPLQEAWSRIGPDEEALLVVDPWNSLVAQYLVGAHDANDASADELQRILVNLVEASRIHLVLVMEGEEPTPLDYLVDGVVVAQLEERGGRVSRWLRLPKLRGVRVENPVYPFTLDGARFQSASPFTTGTQVLLSPPEEEKVADAGSLWPGSRSFANAFGRLPLGGLTLIELDPAVPREVHHLLLAPVIGQVLKLGGRVLLIPPPTLDPEDSFVGLRGLIDEERLERQFRILASFPNDTLSSSLKGVYIPPSRVTWTNDGIAVPLPDDPVFRLERTPGAPNLLVAYFSGLSALARNAGESLTREMLPATTQTVFGNSRAHMIGLGRVGDPYLPEVSAIASLHLRIESRHGRVIVYGERPHTPGFVLTSAEPPLPYHLTRLA